MYCPVKVDGLKGIAKLYVVEKYQDRKHFYLSKIEMVPSDSTGLNAKGEYVPNSSEDTDISIEEIYDFVKAHDKDFEKNSKHHVYFNPKKVYLKMSNPYIATETDIYMLNSAKLKKDGYDGVVFESPNGTMLEK